MSEKKLEAASPGLQVAPIAALILGHAVTDGCINFIPPLWPVFQQRFDLTATDISRLVAFVSVTTNFGQPFFGYLGDRFRVPHMAAAGPMLVGLFIGLMGFADTYALLAVLYMIAGVGTALFHPPGATLAGRVSGELRGLGMALFSGGGALGYASGALLAVALVARFDLPGMLGATVIGGATGLLLLGMRLDRGYGDHETRPLRLRRDVLPHLHKVAMLFTVVTLRAVVIIAFNNFLSLLVKEWGGALKTGGTVLFLLVFFGGVGNIIGGFASDRLGRRNVTVISLIGSAPFFYASARFGLPSIYILLPLAGFLSQASVSVNIVQGQELIPGGPGVASSLTMGAAWGAAGLMMPIVGWAADTWGLVNAMLIVSWVPVVAGLLALGVPDRPVSSQE